MSQNNVGRSKNKKCTTDQVEDVSIEYNHQRIVGHNSFPQFERFQWPHSLGPQPNHQQVCRQNTQRLAHIVYHIPIFGAGVYWFKQILSTLNLKIANLNLKYVWDQNYLTWCETAKIVQVNIIWKAEESHFRRTFAFACLQPNKRARLPRPCPFHLAPTLRSASTKPNDIRRANIYFWIPTILERCAR